PLGLARTPAGPGSTKGLSGLIAAWLDSPPFFFISGQVKRADRAVGTALRQRGVQEVDIVSIVRPITKYAITVTDPQDIRLHLERAVHLARSGRPGPVWLDIPLDVQAASVDRATLAGPGPLMDETKRGPPDLPDLVGKTIKALNAAERPVILVGNGVRIARAEHDLPQLLGSLGIPILTTRLGVD